MSSASASYESQSFQVSHHEGVPITTLKSGVAGSSAPQSGVIVVDKPQGVTSHDVVAAARKLLHTRKVGHAGTLDPMATGVLVIGFGQATRLLNYIVGLDKTYEATIRFGQATDSDDADGQLLDLDSDASSWALSRQARIESVQGITDILLQALIDAQFVGDIQQVPNTFSAIKVHGKRAYDLARQGQSVELQARPITISEFTVLSVGQVHQVQGASASDSTSSAVSADSSDIADTLTTSDTVVDVRVRVTCSAGTYIRALARDLGQELGVGAHLVSLRRTRVGQFSAEDAQTLGASTATREYVDKSGQTHTKHSVQIVCTDEQLANHIIALKQVVTRTLPVLRVSAEQAQDLRFGRVLPRIALAEQLQAAYNANNLVKQHHKHAGSDATGNQQIAAACTPEELVAIVRVGHRRIHPVAVFASEMVYR